MDSGNWEESHLPLIARVAGVAGILFVVVQFLPGSLGGPLFDNVSTAQIVDWAAHNGRAISVAGFSTGFTAAVIALFLFVLIALTHARGLLATVAIASNTVFLALDWVQAGAYYALADSSHRQGADAGIVALFSLTKALTFTDGFVSGMCVVAISILAARSRALPSPLVWLGLVVGVYHLVNGPVQLAMSGTPDGITGPIGVVLILLWILATATTLLIKPIWSSPRREVVAAPAS